MIVGAENAAIKNRENQKKERTCGLRRLWWWRKEDKGKNEHVAWKDQHVVT
jgi:hypothetical protein